MAEPRRTRAFLRFRLALVVAVGVVIAALAIQRAIKPRFASFTGEAMATLWQVTLPDRPGAREAAEACFARYRELDLELSEWKRGSPLSEVNRAAGLAPVGVPPELYALVERALKIGRETDGAFDVTWAALWGTWDFRAESPFVPEAAAIEARRRLVDFRRVVLDPAAGTIHLPETGMKIGLGGIGKGFALDQCAELLRDRGLLDFLLTGGGQVVARGARGRRPWRIGVRDPRGAPDETFARFEITDASLSTSADNESYFFVDGVRYHHVLDPRTGWPARGLRSATVLHRDATLADALSTAILVLGRDRGLEVAETLGAQALVVDDQGEVFTTPALAGRYELLRPPRKDDRDFGR